MTESRKYKYLYTCHIWFVAFAHIFTCINMQMYFHLYKALLPAAGSRHRFLAIAFISYPLSASFIQSNATICFLHAHLCIIILMWMQSNWRYKNKCHKIMKKKLSTIGCGHNCTVGEFHG